MGIRESREIALMRDVAERDNWALEAKCSCGSVIQPWLPEHHCCSCCFVWRERTMKYIARCPHCHEHLLGGLEKLWAALQHAALVWPSLYGGGVQESIDVREMMDAQTINAHREGFRDAMEHFAITGPKRKARDEQRRQEKKRAATIIKSSTTTTPKGFDFTGATQRAERSAKDAQDVADRARALRVTLEHKRLEDAKFAASVTPTTRRSLAAATDEVDRWRRRNVRSQRSRP